jgi:hypothetical protein
MIYFMFQTRPWSFTKQQQQQHSYSFPGIGIRSEKKTPLRSAPALGDADGPVDTAANPDGLESRCRAWLGNKADSSSTRLVRSGPAMMVGGRLLRE